jgi:hypothetical protein
VSSIFDNSLSELMVRPAGQLLYGPVVEKFSSGAFLNSDESQ